MNGLFLQGGGAKGAFQAGVICGLYERGLTFNVISGTSIGAVNSYFIYTDNINYLKNMWLNIDNDILKTRTFKGKVLENKEMIDILESLEGIDPNIKSLYVNYVNISDSKLKEIIVDITSLNKDEQINSIKYSSLLPLNIKTEMSISEMIKNFNSTEISDQFKQSVAKGLYNEFNLDGGILNNNLLQPFLKDKVDKLYLVTLKRNYQIPNYLFETYNAEDIIVIKPKTDFIFGDTLRFEKEFCTSLFNEGYKIAKNLKI